MASNLFPRAHSQGQRMTRLELRSAAKGREKVSGSQGQLNKPSLVGGASNRWEVPKLCHHLIRACYCFWQTGWLFATRGRHFTSLLNDHNLVPKVKMPWDTAQWSIHLSHDPEALLQLQHWQVVREGAVQMCFVKLL